MSVFLLKHPDCVLIHIPKTGGSSIRHGVWGGRYRGPAFGKVPWLWRRKFAFAFVRHPLDRLVSAWADFTQYRGYEGTMSQFVDIATDDAIRYQGRPSSLAESIRHHTLPQTHPYNCLDAAAFVGRHETYRDDLETILKTVGMTAGDVPEMRKTDRRAWSDHLDGPALEKAVMFFRDDFEALDYPVP